MRADGTIRGQGQVGEDLAEQEPRAGLPIEQIRVLADPAQPRISRKRLLEHRGAVDEYAITHRACAFLDPSGEPLQTAA